MLDGPVNSDPTTLVQGALPGAPRGGVICGRRWMLREPNAQFGAQVRVDHRGGT
jgi:hypothetical protein